MDYRNQSLSPAERRKGIEKKMLYILRKKHRPIVSAKTGKKRHITAIFIGKTWDLQTARHIIEYAGMKYSRPIVTKYWYVFPQTDDFRKNQETIVYGTEGIGYSFSD